MKIVFAAPFLGTFDDNNNILFMGYNVISEYCNKGDLESYFLCYCLNLHFFLIQ